MSASSSVPQQGACAVQPDAHTFVTTCGELWSSQPSGAKVVGLRSGAVHLLHTGVPEGWTSEHLAGFFDDAAATLGDPAPGTLAVPSALPLGLQGWMEAVRYGHEELWGGAPDLGTTIVASCGDHLWVLSRGAHRVTVTGTTGAAETERPSGIPGDVRAWRLAVSSGWRVEVALADSPAELWSARWRPAPQAMPETPAAETPAVAAVPRAPSRIEIGIARVLTTLRRPELRPFRRGASVLVALACLIAVVPKRPVAAAAAWASDVIAARYRARVVSDPPGAAIIVDGKEIGARTPATLVLHEGKRRLTLSLGEFGETSVEVEGGRGARRQVLSALHGRLAVGSADTSVVLYALLDGRAIGRVPTILDSVPAGRRRLSFQGRDVRPWTEEVKVVAGLRATVVARPERVPETGHVFARAFRVGPQGLSDLPGARVWLDGRPVGATPLRLQVSRGLHTVRLVTGSESSPVQLLRVEGGAELFATAEFGRSPEPEVAAELTGPPSLKSPPLVRASLAGTAPIRIGDIKLLVRHGGRDFQRVSLRLRDGALGTFGEITLPLAGTTPGREIDYFVVIESDEGEEFVSEMRHLRVLP